MFLKIILEKNTDKFKCKPNYKRVISLYFSDGV